FTAEMDYTNLGFGVKDHSQATIAVQGGAGADTLVAKGTGSSDFLFLGADARLEVDLDGGAGKDALTVDLATPGTLAGVGELRLRLDGGLDNDTITCMIADVIFSKLDFDIEVHGGAGDDSVAFSLEKAGSNPTFGPVGKVVLDGGLGKDELATF